MKPGWREKFLEELASNGGHITMAAHNADISRRHVYRAIEQSPEFAQAVEDAKERAIERVENKLYETAMGGNVVAQIFYLKARRPGVYRETRVNASAEELAKMVEGEFERLDAARQAERERLN